MITLVSDVVLCSEEVWKFRKSAKNRWERILSPIGFYHPKIGLNAILQFLNLHENLRRPTAFSADDASKDSLFVIRTNTIYNLDKCNLQFGQIQFAMFTNTLVKICDAPLLSLLMMHLKIRYL